MLWLLPPLHLKFLSSKRRELVYITCRVSSSLTFCGLWGVSGKRLNAPSRAHVHARRHRQTAAWWTPRKARSRNKSHARAVDEEGPSALLCGHLQGSNTCVLLTGHHVLWFITEKSDTYNTENLFERGVLRTQPSRAQSVFTSQFFTKIKHVGLNWRWASWKAYLRLVADLGKCPKIFIINK